MGVETFGLREVRIAALGVVFAVKVTGLPVNPIPVAARVFLLGPVPRIHEVGRATPIESVTAAPP